MLHLDPSTEQLKELGDGEEYTRIEKGGYFIVRHQIIDNNGHHYRHRIDGPAVYSSISNNAVPQLWYLYNRLIHSGSKPPPDWEEQIKLCLIREIHEL